MTYRHTILVFVALFTLALSPFALAQPVDSPVRETLIAEPGGSTTTDGPPSCAFDSTGNLHVVYSRNNANETRADLYYRRVTFTFVDGDQIQGIDRVGREICLTTDEGSYDAGNPQASTSFHMAPRVVIDSQDRIHVVFCGYGGIWPSETYQRYNTALAYLNFTAPSDGYTAVSPTIALLVDNAYDAAIDGLDELTSVSRKNYSRIAPSLAIVSPVSGSEDPILLHVSWTSLSGWDAYAGRTRPRLSYGRFSLDSSSGLPTGFQPLHVEQGTGSASIVLNVRSAVFALPGGAAQILAGFNDYVPTSANSARFQHYVVDVGEGGVLESTYLCGGDDLRVDFAAAVGGDGILRMLPFRYTFGSPLVEVSESFDWVSRNVAQWSRATASSVGTYLGHVQYPSGAVDGTEFTSWSSNMYTPTSSDPAWIQAEFNGTYLIEEVGVWWSSHQHDYSIFLSEDGSNWTEVVAPRLGNSEEGFVPDSAETFSLDTPQDARFIRVKITSTSAPATHIFQASVAELQAFASTGPKEGFAINVDVLTGLYPAAAGDYGSGAGAVGLDDSLLVLHGPKDAESLYAALPGSDHLVALRDPGRHCFDLAARGSDLVAVFATGPSSMDLLNDHLCNETDNLFLTVFRTPDPDTTTPVAWISYPLDGSMVSLPKKLKGKVTLSAVDAAPVAETYNWYEGGELLGTGQALTVAFADGTHTVELRVSGNAGLDSETVTFTVQTYTGNTPPAPPPPPTPGISVSRTSGLVTTESGGADTFTVVLDTQPTADVTIAVSSDNTGEGTVSPTSLIFTTLNWSAAQTVTVSGVGDDGFVDGDAAYTVLLAAAVSSDSNYSGLDAADVSVTNLDGDVPSGTTYTSTDVSKDIPDKGEGSVSSTLDVNATGLIASLTVTIVTTHERVSDLTVTLESPGGLIETLSGANGTYTTSSFTDEEVNRTWTLVVTDGKKRKIGTLDAWSVTVFTQ